MEVRIERRFELPVTPEQAWALLSDIRAAAACMPGVTITGQEADGIWLGGMRARIGPATMNFKGRVEVQALDPVARRVCMAGTGADTAGSSAVMNLEAHVRPGAAAGTSELVSDASVAVSGRLAQFGSRLLLPVADTLLRSFVANFSQEAARRAAAAQPVQEEENQAIAASPPASVAAPTLSVFAVLWATLRQWWHGRVRRGPPPCA